MTGPEKRGGGRKPRSEAFTFIVHWGLVAVLIASLLTGLRIASDDPESLAGGIARQLPAVLLQGEVIIWHAWAGWVLTFIAIAYAAFLYRSHRLAKVTPSRRIWRRIGNASSQRP